MSAMPTVTPFSLRLKQWVYGLKEAALEAAGRLLRLSGLLRLVISLRLNKRAQMIHYHGASLEVLAKHLEFLAKYFNFISLDDIIQALKKQDWCGIPPRALVITFDDGLAGNYQLLSLFKAYNLRPVIYLTSFLVTGAYKLWTRAIGVDDQQRAKLLEEMKRVPQRQWEEYLRKEFNYSYENEYQPRQGLTLEEIRQMQPDVIFGCHSRHHSVLPNCDTDKAWEEINGARCELEALLEAPVKHFSYPYGMYGFRDKEMVQESGYLSARSGRPGSISLKTNPYELPSVHIGDAQSLNYLALKLCGITAFLPRNLKMYFQS